MAGSMAKGTAATTWRRLLVLLIVTGAALVWVKARRRRGSMPRSWSELDSSAPVSLRPAVSEPEPPASEVSGVAVGPLSGPYPGSVLPLDDGSAPSAEYVVKGNAGSMRSHSADSPYFGRTRAEVWFRSQDDAVAAGFAPWAPKK